MMFHISPASSNSRASSASTDKFCRPGEVRLWEWGGRRNWNQPENGGEGIIAASWVKVFKRAFSPDTTIQSIGFIPAHSDPRCSWRPQEDIERNTASAQRS